MQTKLTLRIDEKLIARAKKTARARGKSVSQMVAEYFVRLDSQRPIDPDQLPPTTLSLKGFLGSGDLSREDYRRYLEEKHR